MRFYAVWGGCLIGGGEDVAFRTVRELCCEWVSMAPNSALLFTVQQTPSILGILEQIHEIGTSARLMRLSLCSMNIFPVRNCLLQAAVATPRNMTQPLL